MCLTEVIFFPKFDIVGTYKGIGKFLLLNINTTGQFIANFSDVFVRGSWNAKKYVQNGEDYLKFVDAEVEPDIKGLHLELTNLIPNNPEITKNTNDAINANIDVLYKELSPVIHDTMLSFVEDALNSVYGIFPIDVLWPVD